jgi:hypothetical protein
MEEIKNLNFSRDEYPNIESNQQELILNRLKNNIILDVKLITPGLKHCLSKSIINLNNTLDQSEIAYFKSCMETYTSVYKLN